MNEQTAMLSGITAYKDLCAEIDILRLRAEDQEVSLKYARRKMDNNGLPWSNGKPVIVSLDKALEEYDEVLVALQQTLDVLESKEDVKEQMEEAIQSIEGVEMAVAYYRDALGMPLREIADRLGYSEVHIKRISAKLNRHK